MKYSGKYLNEIALPLGGIGTGSISLTGRGMLTDWEIFNKPNKGYRPIATFFSVFCKEEKKDPLFRVLEGELVPPYQGNIHDGTLGFGYTMEYGMGLPRFRNCTFEGKYPVANINLSDPSMPLKIQLKAFNPLIPLNDKDSSIPAAIFKWSIKNTSRKKIKVSVAFNMQNIAGYPVAGRNLNEFKKEKNFQGMFFSTQKHIESSALFGNLAVVTPNKKVTYNAQWGREIFPYNRLIDFIDDFAKKGRFKNQNSTLSDDSKTDVGSIALEADIAPGEETVFPFILSWYSPNFERGWDNHNGPLWKNYYATQWKDAWDVAGYTSENLARLEKETDLYVNSFFSSTMPDYVLDAAASNLSVIKSPTCIRYEDGTLWGFEGVFCKCGCCPGSCTHVWNYAQAVPYLFPKLERGMRDIDYLFSQNDEGKMQFRIELPKGESNFGFHAAADGQLGGVMRVYREWLISGNTEWLKKIWPRVKKALEYSFIAWDKNKDGVIEGFHHNTYDIEFYGIEPLAQIVYLGALKAAAEMAKFLGESDKAQEYQKLFESGSAKTDKEIFNGEYYYQKLNKEEAMKNNQYGKGCLSDQLLGQWYARMLDMGDLVDPLKTKKALRSVYKYNFKESFHDHLNIERSFALNDEKALLIGTWPKGGKPKKPMPYMDEALNGVEYQVASHLIYEGMIKEGLSITKAIRDRYDGFRRNPYNEFECGNHYVRSMASWALILALSGFHYNAVEKSISFAPAINKNNFRSFFSVCSGWGMYSQKTANNSIDIKIEILYGKLDIKKIKIGYGGVKKNTTVKFNGKIIPKEKISFVKNNVIVETSI